MVPIFLEKIVLMNKKCFTAPHKKRYSTEKKAQTALLLNNSPNIRVYFCVDCVGWHLTSRLTRNFS